MLTLLIIIGIIVLVGLFGVAIYNRLVRLRALVKEAFSGITVQLPVCAGSPGPTDTPAP